MRDRRRDIASAYDEAFSSLDGLETIEYPSDRENAYHIYVLKLSTERGISRDQAIVEMKARGIGTSVHFIPLHMHPYYKVSFGYTDQTLPIAAELYSRSLSLPLYSGMADTDVARVIAAVREIADASKNSSGTYDRNAGSSDGGPHRRQEDVVYVGRLTDGDLDKNTQKMA